MSLTDSGFSGRGSIRALFSNQSHVLLPTLVLTEALLLILPTPMLSSET